MQRWLPAPTGVPGFAGRSIETAEPKQELTTLYPNPTSDELIIQRTGGGLVSTVSFQDMNGKTVLTQQLTGPLEKINTSRLQSGTYLVSIIENGRLIRREKIIIQH
ncbi:MAG: T9SS type A sorting domain-containing protein [Chitinophagaceae bacterium]|nr:T9SS type A sorting domain-containing protein [Chitinophagaceae bacterium]